MTRSNSTLFLIFGISLSVLSASLHANLATGLASSSADRFATHTASHLAFRRFVKYAKESHGFGEKNSPFLPMVWVHEHSIVSRNVQDSKIPPIHSHETGVIAGYDFCGTPTRVFGVSAAYEFCRSADRNNNQATVQATAPFVYGMQYFSNFYLLLIFLGGYDALYEQRNPLGNEADFVATASWNNYQFAPLMGCGYDFDFEWGIIEPYAFADIVFNFQSGFKENHGGAFDLKQNSNFSSVLYTQIGVRSYQNWFTEIGLIGMKEFLALRKRNILQRGTHGANSLGGDKSLSFFFSGVEVIIDLKSQYYWTLQYTLELGNGLTSQGVRTTLGRSF